MADIAKDERDTHELVLHDRKTLNMNGVIEVISFDDISVSLKTKCGELYVEGTDLHISALDTVKGAVSVNGNINSLSYYDIKHTDRKSRFGIFTK